MLCCYEIFTTRQHDTTQKNLRRNPLRHRAIFMISGQKSHYALRAHL